RRGDAHRARHRACPGSGRGLDRRRRQGGAHYRHGGLALLRQDLRPHRHHLHPGLLEASRRDDAHRRPHRRVERLSLLHQVADGMVLLARLPLQLRASEGNLVLGSQVHADPSPLGAASMRYLIAMLVAIVVTVLVTVFVSPQLASMVVDRFSFESPDEVGNLEDGVYILSNLPGLLVAWGIGWVIGGRLASRPAPPA